MPAVKTRQKQTHTRVASRTPDPTVPPPVQSPPSQLLSFSHGRFFIRVLSRGMFSDTPAGTPWRVGPPRLLPGRRSPEATRVRSHPAAARDVQTGDSETRRHRQRWLPLLPSLTVSECSRRIDILRSSGRWLLTCWHSWGFCGSLRVVGEKRDGRCGQAGNTDWSRDRGGRGGHLVLALKEPAGKGVDAAAVFTTARTYLRPHEPPRRPKEGEG